VNILPNQDIDLNCCGNSIIEPLKWNRVVLSERYFLRPWRTQNFTDWKLFTYCCPSHWSSACVYEFV